MLLNAVLDQVVWRERSPTVKASCCCGSFRSYQLQTSNFFKHNFRLVSQLNLQRLLLHVVVGKRIVLDQNLGNVRFFLDFSRFGIVTQGLLPFYHVVLVLMEVCYYYLALSANPTSDLCG